MKLSLGKKLVYHLVLTSLVLSLIMPAFLYPLAVDWQISGQLSKANQEKIEELAFKLLGAQEAKALMPPPGASPGQAALEQAFGVASGVPVIDETTARLQAGANAILDYTEQKETLWKSLQNAVYVAGKEGLHYLLNTMAYDIATWLASGGKGQQPMFFTEGWGDYLLNLVDAAGGQFLESLGRQWNTKFNICDPNFNIKIRIGLGLGNLDRPRPPKCTITKLINNWSKLTQDRYFLDKFDDIFDPESNDVGIAISMFGKYVDYKDDVLLGGILKRQEGKGYKSVGTAIADKILTPGDLVSAEAEEALSKGTAADENVDYGDIFTYAIGTFINTLAGKLFQRFFQEGLASLFGGSSGSSNKASNSSLRDLLGNLISQDLYNFSAGQANSGREAAQLRFADFLQAGINKKLPYDVLSKLTVCTDAQNPAPDECIINQSFRTAIEKKMTLKKAIAEHYIDGSKPFGFMDYSGDALARGYSFRSIVALRTLRIVPVGWELAAKAINQFDKDKVLSLNDLMGVYYDDRPDNLYYGLVDPNWVLKAPEYFCRAIGYGPKIFYQNNITNADGSQSLVVNRAEYCADLQSCIEEKPDGSCRYYGYCTEERRVWNLAGKDCPAEYNTCQTFQSSQGQIGSFLKNTLNYDSCSADNAGCLWYCQAYNAISDVWTCANEKPLESERVLKPCNVPSGCFESVSCKLNEGEDACSDSTSQANLKANEPCHSGSSWWQEVPGKCNISGNGECILLADGRTPQADECLNDTSGSKACSVGQCDVKASCTIPYGGVTCNISTCTNLNNLLPNFGFETAAKLPTADFHIASGWYTTEEGQAYFAKVKGATEMIYPDGKSKNSLRFFSFGDTDEENVYSDFIKLPVGKYTFSGYAYDFLNKSGATLSVIGNISTAEKRSTTKGLGWQRLSFPFTVDGSGLVQVRIQVGGPSQQVGGRIWFDNFKISEECVVNQAVLSLIGTVEQDQSKIHLDNQAEICEEEAEGCSEFIRTKLNLGTNLVRNSSFEAWDPNLDYFPPGWQAGENVGTNLKVEKYADSSIDQHSVKITNTDSNSRAFETIPLPEIKNNTTYRVSFWAKSESKNESWQVQILSDHYPPSTDDFCSLKPSVPCTVDTDCQPDNGKCLFDDQDLIRYNDENLKLTTEWQRFIFDPIITRVSSFDFKLSFGNTSNDPIYLDGVQIEEIERGSDLISTYNDYGKTNLTYLKKPPAYLSCQGYTSDRPSPYFIQGIQDYESCTAENRVWRKFCSGGTNDGEVCNDGTNCTGGTCQADSCDAIGQLCCHYIDLPECANYARYCQQDEVGCELYTPIKAGQSIPAVVAYQDYCPLECVGYQAYKQSPTFFESQESMQYFIPRTAVKCSASNNGCTQFTNLDEVAAGGEGLYYYKYLRICKKPNESGANCQNFYNWEGSDESGYQLRVYSLNANTDGSPEEPTPYNSAAPDDVNWPTAWCDDYGGKSAVGVCQGGTNAGDVCLSSSTCTGGGTCGNYRPACCNGPEDLATNPFCREFYATNGNIYYRIYDNTKTCSEDCHPFRKTRLGESDTEMAGYCTGTGGIPQNNTCVYQAIPSQGVKCAAGASGCREFRGNAGANIFTVFADNFEDGSSKGWRFGIPSSDSLTVSGHSLKASGNPPQIFTTKGESTVGDCKEDLAKQCSSPTDYNCYDLATNTCRFEDPNNHEICSAKLTENQCGVLDHALISGRTYLISFWAKSGSGNVIRDFAVKLLGALAEETIATTTIGVDWNYYEVGPIVAKDEVDSGSQLGFVGPLASNNYSFVVDNITIKEVNDYVYVIKNSWQTPKSCDTNPFLAKPISAPQFMLGCQQYRDSSSRVHNLKSFDQLCREEMVGCEALIDTHNSASPFSEIFNISDEISDVKVPADTPVFMVNRAENQCNSSNKGCQKVGLPEINTSSEVTGYETVYLINNPNQYEASLCTNEEVGCQAWQTGDGFAYFKDPGDRTCEYRLVPGTTNDKQWFKTGSSSSVRDCPIKQPPLGQVHPADNFVGICPSEHSTCNLFIEPTSEFAKNIVYNNAFKVTTGSTPDGWTVVGPSGNSLTQKIKTLKDNTLYTISFSGNKINLGGLKIEITNCLGITSFDHSLRHVCSDDTTYCSTDADCGAGTCDKKTLAIPAEIYRGDDRNATDISGLPDIRQYSGRFFMPYKQECELKLEDVSIEQLTLTLKDNISIRQTDTSYVLENSIEKYSCNGLVNAENGCVLFNDRSGVNYKLGEDDISYLNFDADTSGPGINNGQAVYDCAGNCDSNAILKVTPDRVCETWLSCDSAAIAYTDKGEARNYCLALNTCNSLDPRGQCSNIIPKDTDSKSDTYLGIDQIKNLSGYVNAGLFFDAGQIRGYYPYSLMPEIGEAANVPNGNFESTYGGTSQPLGWDINIYNQETTDYSWARNKFEVAYDPKYRQQDLGYLKLYGSYQAKSERTDVVGMGEESTSLEPAIYILSAWINTLALEPTDVDPSDIKNNTYAQAEILFKFNNGTANGLFLGANSTSGCNEIALGNLAGWIHCPSGENSLTLQAGLNWQHRALTMKVPKDIKSIEFLLANTFDYPNDFGCSDDSEKTICKISGYSMFDNISLMPVLKVNEEKTVDRSCRVYPASDALGCNYFKDNTSYNGQNGYCLTPDPANKSQCLQWWPVDQLKGEALNDAAGYNGPVPVYYCTEGKAKSDYQLGGGEDLLILLAASLLNLGDLGEVNPEISMTDGDEVTYDVSEGGTKAVLAACVIWREGGQPDSDYGFSYKLLGKDQSWVSTGVIDGGDYHIRCAAWAPGILDLIVEDILGLGAGAEEVVAYILGLINSPVVPVTHPIDALKVICVDGDNGSRVTNEKCEYNKLGVYTLNFSHVWGECTQIVQAVTSVGNIKAFATRVSAGSNYKLNFDEFSQSPGIPSGQSYTYNALLNPFGALPNRIGLPETWYDIISQSLTIGDMTFQGGSKEPVRVANFDLTNQQHFSNGGVPYKFNTELGGIATTFVKNYIGQCETSKIMCLDSKGLDFWNIPSCPIPNEKCILLNCPLDDLTGESCFNKLSEHNYPSTEEPNKMLQRLFVENYGVWNWDVDQGRYVQTTNEEEGWDWTIPAKECHTSNDEGITDTGIMFNRATSTLQFYEKNDYCFIRPIINGIKFDTYEVNGSANVRLDFNAKVDPDQMPLKFYKIDWGDGQVNSVSGVNLRSRVNPENAFSFYHFFDYWQMLQYRLKLEKESKSHDFIACGALADEVTGVPASIPVPVDECWARPNIWVQDNWYIMSDSDSVTEEDFEGTSFGKDKDGNDIWLKVKNSSY